MKLWVEFAPKDGWGQFQRSEALTTALWERLNGDAWAYYNFVSTSSVWEYQEDGSMLSVDYEGERIVHFAAQPGAAANVAILLTEMFGLIEVSG